MKSIWICQYDAITSRSIDTTQHHNADGLCQFSGQWEHKNLDKFRRHLADNLSVTSIRDRVKVNIE